MGIKGLTTREIPRRSISLAGGERAHVVNAPKRIERKAQEIGNVETVINTRKKSVDFEPLITRNAWPTSQRILTRIDDGFDVADFLTLRSIRFGAFTT